MFPWEKYQQQQQVGPWTKYQTSPAASAPENPIPKPAEKPTLYPIVDPRTGFKFGETTKTPFEQSGLAPIAEGVTSGILGLPGELIEAPQRLTNVLSDVTKPLTGIDFSGKIVNPLPNESQVSSFLYGPPKDDLDRAARFIGGTASAAALGPIANTALRVGGVVPRLAERAFHALFYRRYMQKLSGKAGELGKPIVESLIHKHLGEALDLEKNAEAQAEWEKTAQEHLQAIKSAEENHTNSEAQARAVVGEKAAALKTAQDTGKALADAELRLPQASDPEEFSRKLQKTALDEHDRLTAVRREQSGFNEAVTSAGDNFLVDTSGIADQIQALLGTEDVPGKVMNPSLENTLKFILFKTKENEKIPGGANKWTIEQADSMRKTLGRIIRGTEAALPGRLDSEAVTLIKRIRSSLIDQATRAWTPYGIALEKYRALSRPLDIFNPGATGALAKVVAKDPMSFEPAMQEAQTVGSVLRQARQGFPALTRLVAANPTLREDAKLYFTWELFGSGSPPTAAKLSNWLRLNAQPLEQLGLTRYFQDLHAARQTAETSIELASGELDQAKAAHLAATNQREIATLRRKAQESEVADIARGRAHVEKQAAKARAGLQEYQTISTEIDEAVRAGNWQRAFGSVKRLLDKAKPPSGDMTQSDYAAALQSLMQTKDSIANTALFAHRLRQIALGAIILRVENPLVRRNWYSVKNMLGL